MNLTDLTKDFKLNIKYIEPLTYLTLNGKTTVLNYEEIEGLEYGLASLAHAISLYKRSEFPLRHCNTLHNEI